MSEDSWRLAPGLSRRRASAGFGMMLDAACLDLGAREDVDPGYMFAEARGRRPVGKEPAPVFTYIAALMRSASRRCASIFGTTLRACAARGDS